MSDNDSEVAEIIYNVQISIIDNYCMIAAATLIIFEYFATICHEIELVWYRKITGATILFLLNRWFNIGVAVGLVILIPNYSTQPSNEVMIITRIKKDADRVNMKASLVTLLLRDGTLYFVLLLILNILHMTLYLTNVFFDMIYFVGPISSIIISRFLLNLRQVYQTDDSDDARPSFVRSNVSDICFAAAIVGNLGAPLSYGESRTSRSETTTFVTGISDVDTTSPASEYGFDLIEPPQMAKDPLRVDLDLISTSEDIELAHT
ncbi:hypothetical protein B0H21DRAFT_820668 [Amylocystis lapponica]|nr:hypothetical protein B0H21DRAFT_820668 [Amylocystis lapponica]